MSFYDSSDDRGEFRRVTVNLDGYSWFNMENVEDDKIYGVILDPWGYVACC